MGHDKIPWDIRQQCLWIIRGYDRARREYFRARREILDAGGQNFTTAIVDGVEQRVYMPGARRVSRTTEDKQLRLEALEQTQAFKQMRAVEHARAKIGAGFPAEMQDKLRDAIMLNCIDGRKYPFERLFVTGVSRSDFYRARNDFFRAIAMELGLF